MPDALAKAVQAQGLDAVVLGIRPEHLLLDPAGPVTVTVAAIESLGHERHLLCELQDAREVIVRTSSAAPVPGEGATIHLDAAPGALHLFDADSGRRLH